MLIETAPIEPEDTPTSWSERFFARCQSFCEKKNAHRYAYFLPLVLFSPTLFLGLQMDDYIHYWRLHFVSENISFGDATWYLFEFYQAPNTLHFEKGVLPWWLSEDTVVSFFRPIAAWTHWLDAILWKDLFFMHHLHSLLWACLTVWVAHRVFVQLMGKGWGATLGTFVFACHDAHTLPFAWLANRNMAISFFFAMLSFSLFLRAHKEKRSPWLAVILFTVSLFAAESSVSILGLMVAWAWIYIPSKKNALLSLLPYIGITVAWRILHKAMGYGAKGLHLYIDPANDPLLFGKEALLRLPTLLLSLMFKFPLDSYLIAGQISRILMASAGVLGTLGLLILCRSAFQKNQLAMFWIGSIFLMVLPVCATEPHDRTLFFASFSFTGLLICLLRRHRGLLAKRLLVLHLPIAALLCFPKIAGLHFLSDTVEMGYRSFPTDLREGQHLIFVNGLEFPAMYSAMLPIVHEDDVHPPVAILSASPDATLTVTGSHELDIDMPQGWFTQMMLFGPTQAFAVGDRIKRPGFEAIVQAVNAEHEPTRVRFVFEESIDGDRYRWMKWVGNRYEEIERSSLSKEPLYIPSPLPFDP